MLFGFDNFFKRILWTPEDSQHILEWGLGRFGPPSDVNTTSDVPLLDEIIPMYCLMGRFGLGGSNMMGVLADQLSRGGITNGAQQAAFAWEPITAVWTADKLISAAEAGEPRQLSDLVDFVVVDGANPPDWHQDHVRLVSFNFRTRQHRLLSARDTATSMYSAGTSNDTKHFFSAQNISEATEYISFFPQTDMGPDVIMFLWLEESARFICLSFQCKLSASLNLGATPIHCVATLAPGYWYKANVGSSACSSISLY